VPFLGWLFSRTSVASLPWQLGPTLLVSSFCELVVDLKFNGIDERLEVAHASHFSKSDAGFRARC
jgi:hypothetical protein